MSWRVLVEPDGTRWVNPLWRLELVKAEREALKNNVKRLRGLLKTTEFLAQGCYCFHCDGQSRVCTPSTAPHLHQKEMSNEPSQCRC
jgi:hypothetical protein